MKPNRLLPWVGWNAGERSMVLLPEDELSLRRTAKPVPIADAFVEMTKLWWEKFASANDWESAVKIAKISTERRPNLAYGWENWAWALHRQGKTRNAYKLLAPLLKNLSLAGPPSGRAAYCLACFCGELGKIKEATRWLRLAYTLAVSKDAFTMQALLEPDLRPVWPGLPELRSEALSVLE